MKDTIEERRFNNPSMGNTSLTWALLQGRREISEDEKRPYIEQANQLLQDFLASEVKKKEEEAEHQTTKKKAERRQKKENMKKA